MSKKRLIIGILIGAILISTIGALIKRPIIYFSVNKVILKTYSHSNTEGITEVVLTRSEARKAVRMYNSGGVDYGINAEPCCAAYWLEIYFLNGTHLSIQQGTRDSLIVDPLIGDRFYVKSKSLINYIKELITQYNMVSD